MLMIIPNFSIIIHRNKKYPQTWKYIIENKIDVINLIALPYFQNKIEI